MCGQPSAIFVSSFSVHRKTPSWCVSAVVCALSARFRANVVGVLFRHTETTLPVRIPCKPIASSASELFVHEEHLVEIFADERYFFERLCYRLRGIAAVACYFALLVGFISFLA
jgi:hypothetical protein